MAAFIMPIGTAERIEAHLREAQVLRRVAAALSLRQARATVVQAAIRHELAAARLKDPLFE